MSLVLVACEDTYVVQQYLEALERNGAIDTRRVHVHLLPTDDDGRSAPKHVLDRLVTLEQRLDERLPMDARWLVLDVDHHATGAHTRDLSATCREAVQRGYRLALSNPCFELWLLLHHTDAAGATTCADCAEALRKVLGGYNKTRLSLGPWTAEALDNATQRARALDTDPSQRWPQAIGSHVYKLVESLPRR